MIQHPTSEAVTWKQRLKDSSWVTLAWDWFQTFLGRTVEAVLWLTMICTCYSLIPGAPPLPSSVSSVVFIAQFVALDIGGIGLNKLAIQQGLGQWSYTRVIAYILIGITLITITYAGIEHALDIPVTITNWVEALLVVARSVMTILYAQAIHAMKVEVSTTQTLLEEQRVQLDSAQQEVSTLKRQLDSERNTVSNLRTQLDALSGQVDRRQGEVSSLREELDGKRAELDALRRQLEAGQQEASTLRTQVSSEQRVQAELSGLRGQVEHKQQEVDTLTRRLSTVQQEVSTLKAHLDSERQKVSTLQQQPDSRQATPLDTGQQGRVIPLDSGRAKRKAENGQDAELVQRIRTLMKQEPGISARKIAERLGCSPTTAAKWKAFIEQEQGRGQDQQCAN
jgi:predicted RNase H-like nuclease (RuvC/YqgF family)